MNKNLRPYCLSIDWLQLHLHIPCGFDHEAPQPVSFANVMNLNHSYSFKFVGHGSKTYKTIINVLENDVPFGQLSLHPYSSQINPASCNFKLENRCLYEPDLFGRVQDFIQTYGFKYLGITRLDIAYDFNELYGGLSPQHFLKKIQQCHIIKRGSNDRWSHVHANFQLAENFASGQKALIDDIAIPETHSDDPAKPTPWEVELQRQQIYKQPHCLIKLPEERNLLRPAQLKKESDLPFSISSMTWGSRSCGHQVQIYNKTLEMQQVKYKHHIARRWQQCGLDLDKDVYRVEMRLTKGAKLLKNLENDSLHILDMKDIMLDEQLEQLWFDYTDRYFHWFILDKKDRRSSDGSLERSWAAMVAHTSRLKDYRIFCNCLRNNDGEATELTGHVFTPKTADSKNDYSRSIKLAMNVIEGAIKKTADEEQDYTRKTLENAYDYLRGIFGLEKKVTLERASMEIPSEISIDCLRDPKKYYEHYWAGTNTKWFDRATALHAANDWAKFEAQQMEEIREELARLGFAVPLAIASEAYEAYKLTGSVPDEMLMTENLLGEYNRYHNWDSIKERHFKQLQELLNQYSITADELARHTHAQDSDLPF